jgi:hypothetical protein
MYRFPVRIGTRLLVCVGAGSHGLQSRSRSHPRPDKKFLSIDDQKFLDAKWEKILVFKSVSTPLTYVHFLKDHHKCIEILPKVLHGVTGIIDKNTNTKVYNNAITLFCHFWDSGRFKQAFNLAKFLPPESVREYLDQFQTLRNGAFFCYEWSKSSKPQEILLEEIRAQQKREINTLRQQVVGNLIIPHSTIIKDQHGIPRAFVAVAWVDDPNVETRPKLYITLTGTRNDDQVKWHMLLKQWLLTNLNFFSKDHPGGWSTHSGFQAMSDHLEKEILKILIEKIPPEQLEKKIEVCIVGHSLGGAIANIMALSLAGGEKKDLFHTCIAYTLATPCAFRGSVKIPENVLIQNFVHRYDVVTTDKLSYHPIGETYVLTDSTGWFKSPIYLHTKFFHDFFNNFSFENGEKALVETVTYNHDGEKVTGL